jgi:hypothetical protein
MQAAALLDPPRSSAPAPAPDAKPGALQRFFELPLNRWQLFDSGTLRSSKIVLASDLNPVIDFFNSEDVGIGGRNAKQTAAELHLSSADEQRLAALLRLRSYDVYSLRAALGAHLAPEQFEKLVLPDSEKRLLEGYTRDYTRALFALIFQDGTQEVPDRQRMRELLEGSTTEIVQKNVMVLAQKFGIKPVELVNYIAGLGEMLLAIAFYRRAFETSLPGMQQFLKEIRSIVDNAFVRARNPELAPGIEKMVGYGVRTIKLMQAYFASFDDIGRIWENITPERFRKIREQVEEQYPTIGTTLCIWQVKISAWNYRFHRHGRKAADNSPVQFAQFFQERILPDFGKVTVHLDRIEQFGRGVAA